MARRAAGLNPAALGKVQADIARPASPAEKRTLDKLTGVGSGKSQGRRKVHAGAFVLDEAFNEEQHDLGPWTQAPKSTRVDAYRYDYHNQALQVTWRNGKNHGYIYLEVPYEGYRSFSRVVSKGRYINSFDKEHDYRLMTPDEVSAPSNPDRGGLVSRVRG